MNPHDAAPYRRASVLKEGNIVYSDEVKAPEQSTEREVALTINKPYKEVIDKLQAELASVEAERDEHKQRFKTSMTMQKFVNRCTIGKLLAERDELRAFVERWVDFEDSSATLSMPDYLSEAVKFKQKARRLIGREEG